MNESKELVSPQTGPTFPRANILGRYRAFAKLARGGMADIFLALAEGAVGANKIVAIKRLRSDIEDDNKSFGDMFLDEARLTTLLDHPNIVQTHEVGEDQGSLFMVMDYAEGQTLQSIIRMARKGPQMSAVMVCKIISEVLSALHYAHELRDVQGHGLSIVHRDVSPQNVIVGYDGRVRLLDFGIAQATLQTTETEVGVLKGKVRYMAPEQVSPNGTVDRRSDIFACGVVLWELLTKQRLFSNDMTVTSLVSLVNPSIPAPNVASVVPDISPELDAIVARALAKAPDARYQTALDMRRALEAFISSSIPNPTREDIGEFLLTHFSEAREKLAERVRSELLAAQAAPDSRTRSATKLEGLADLQGNLSTRDLSGARTLSTSGSGPGSESGREAPLKAAERSIQRETPPEDPRAQTDKRLVWLGGLIALILLGVLGALLVLLTRKEGAVASTRPERSAPEVDVQTFVRGAPSTPPSSPSVEVPVAMTAEAKPKPAWALPPANNNKWPPNQPVRSAATVAEVKPAPSEVRTEPAVTAAAPAKDPGFLTIDTYPWTRVSEAGRVLGTTPLVRAQLSPGTHTLSLDNPAENIHQTTTVVIKSGEPTVKRLAF